MPAATLQATEDYFVIVQVRENAKVILEQDRTFNVSCNRQNRWGTAAARQSRLTRVEMGVFDGRHAVKTHDLAYGRPYDIVVRLVQDCWFFAPFKVLLDILKTCSF